MTGYGRVEKKIGETSVAIELRAVNSRFLEFVMRLPRGYEEVEDNVRTSLQAIMTRGRVTVTMNVGTDQSSLGKPRLDENLLQHYQQIANKAARVSGQESAALPLSELLRFPDVISYSINSEDRQKFMASVMELVSEAIEQLQAMRIREGELLEAGISAQLVNMIGILDRIKSNDGGRLDILAEKMRKKIADSGLVTETQIDEKRIEQEVLIWSDKLDITEELDRLDAHVQHFRDLMKANGDAGKRLNFLLQEMNREANTIGSKANSTPIGHAVVELKNEIERIREQVQNIQ